MKKIQYIFEHGISGEKLEVGFSYEEEGTNGRLCLNDITKILLYVESGIEPKDSRITQITENKIEETGIKNYIKEQEKYYADNYEQYCFLKQCDDLGTPEEYHRLELWLEFCGDAILKDKFLDIGKHAIFLPSSFVNQDLFKQEGVEDKDRTIPEWIEYYCGITIPWVKTKLVDLTKNHLSSLHKGTALQSPDKKDGNNVYSAETFALVLGEIRRLLLGSQFDHFFDKARSSSSSKQSIDNCTQLIRNSELTESQIIKQIWETEELISSGIAQINYQYRFLSKVVNKLRKEVN